MNCCIVGFKRFCERWQAEDPDNEEIKELTNISLEILKIAIFLQLKDKVLKDIYSDPMSYLENVLLTQFVVPCDESDGNVKIVGYEDARGKDTSEFYFMWCAFVYTYVIKDMMEREYFLAYACLPHFLYKLQKFEMVNASALESLLRRFPENERMKVRKWIRGFQLEKNGQVLLERFKSYVEEREEFALLEMQDIEMDELREKLVEGVVFANKILCR